MLVDVIPSVIADPVSKVLGSVAKEIVKAILDNSTRLEQQLGRLLDAPFRTGTVQLRAYLQTSPVKDEERDFWIDKLRQASNHLDEAYELAATPDRKLLVRSMQTITVALLPGATYLFNSYVSEFENRSRQLKIESERLREEAIRMGDYISGFFVGLSEGQQIVFEARAQRQHYSRKYSLTMESENLMRQAKETDIFIDFVKALYGKQK